MENAKDRRQALHELISNMKFPFSSGLYTARRDGSVRVGEQREITIVRA